MVVVCVCGGWGGGEAEQVSDSTSSVFHISGVPNTPLPSSPGPEGLARPAGSHDLLLLQGATAS